MSTAAEYRYVEAEWPALQRVQPKNLCPVKQWCERELQSTGTSVDIPTFADFLETVKSPTEVRHYVDIYLGVGKVAEDFVNKYVLKRKMGVQERSTGNATSSKPTPKQTSAPTRDRSAQTHPAARSDGDSWSDKDAQTDPDEPMSSCEVLSTSNKNEEGEWKDVQKKTRKTATVFASPMGLKVTVEDAKCIQANAFIQEGIFQEYSIKEEQISFKINLTVLLECLTVFGSSPLAGAATSLKMCYSGYGCPLILMLEEDGVLTDCSIKTLEPDEVLDFNFSSTNVVNKIIMKSECLKEAFNELDMTSDILQFLMSPDPPHFRLSTFGNAGSMHSDFPKDSDMMESFQCPETHTNRYKVSLLKPSVKALALSSRVSIRTDTRGFLSLQYMVKNEDGQVCFVEYYCAPDEDVDDPDH